MLCYGCMTSINEDDVFCPYCGFKLGTEPTEIFHLSPGTELSSRYTLGKVIGCGGFGVTYIGWDSIAEKKVAIKEYFPNEFATRVTGKPDLTVFSGSKGMAFRDGLSKFVLEARKLTEFTNIEGIVKIYDCFEENQTAYIVMEYLEGETLEERITREGKIESSEAIALLLPIMNALDKVHADGIIHRDIAPDNIFITKDGKTKLLDFGAARNAQLIVEESRTVIVKKGYSPEEQYASRSPQTSATDVYAMAAIFYRVLTGKYPPDALERRLFFIKNNKDMLVSISKEGVNVPAHVEKAILNALQIGMDDRTQTMSKFVEELTTAPVKKSALVKNNNVEKRIVSAPNGTKYDKDSKKRLFIVLGIIAVIFVIYIIVMCSLLFKKSDNMRN